MANGVKTANEVVSGDYNPSFIDMANEGLMEDDDKGSSTNFDLDLKLPGAGYDIRNPYRKSPTLAHPQGEIGYRQYDRLPEDYGWDDVMIKDGLILDANRRMRGSNPVSYGVATPEFEKGLADYKTAQSDARYAQRQAQKQSSWLDPSDGEKYGPLEGLFKLPLRAAGDILGITGETGALIADTVTGGNLPDWAKDTVNIGTQIAAGGGIGGIRSLLRNPFRNTRSATLMDDMGYLGSGADDLARLGPGGRQLHFSQPYMSPRGLGGNTTLKVTPPLSRTGKVFNQLGKAYNLAKRYPKTTALSSIALNEGVNLATPRNHSFLDFMSEGDGLFSTSFWDYPGSQEESLSEKDLLEYDTPAWRKGTNIETNPSVNDTIRWGY
tara:strand:- start:265 stop:1407 length:1143 start_codon:yes stop_codon:yes gene_type:complete